VRVDGGENAEERSMLRSNALLNEDDRDDAWVLDKLLHPALAFAQASDVITDPDLTLNEKRAILASWASDACAIEAVPSLRRLPKGKRLVPFDEVMDALRALDKEVREQGRAATYDRVRRRSSRGSSDEGQGHVPN
jgi:hypothetical protein